MTDETGIIRTQYAYDPFGNVTITGEASDNPFQYTGRENDGTGLYYYRARYYSPELQRFISEDPIGLMGGINFYVYVRNNPVNFVDPEGLHMDCLHGGCRWHLSCTDGHEHPNRDSTSAPCKFDDKPPFEIPEWACDVGEAVLCDGLMLESPFNRAACKALFKLYCGGPKECN